MFLIIYDIIPFGGDFMTLEQIMKCKKFLVIGSTENKEKYAYKIKESLMEKGYIVNCVNKNNPISLINDEVEIIDLCINPIIGLSILKEYKDLKKVKAVLIQPGAESEEIIEYLKEQNVDYLEGCALVGLALYS